MLRGQKLLLFHALLILAGFNVHALSQRVFLSAPDPVAWEKLILAVVMQAIAIGGLALYLRRLGRAGISLLERNPSLFTRGLKISPLIVCGLLAAASLTVLYNAISCGNHPLPTNRGMTTCPR